MHTALGVSFIEVIVSLVLLSLILLSLDAMQIAALRDAKAAYYFSVATNQLSNMAELMNMSDQIDTQVSMWNVVNQTVLPQGNGVVDLEQVTLFWGSHENECWRNKIGQSGCLKMKILK